MKREAHGHTKMKRLCKMLELPLWGAVGILESLWKLTAQEAPQGDIGKLSDEDIALGIDWKGDSGVLVSALKESRWIDASDAHRYIIHDWHEHSDDSLDMKLARCGKLYANDYTPRMSKLSKEERTKICAVFAWPGPSVIFRGTKRHEKALPVTSHQSPAPGPAPAPPAAPPPEPPYDFSADPEETIPDDLPAAPLGNFLLERLSIPHSYSLAVKFSDAVTFIARDEGCQRGDGAKRLLQRARARPPGDGKWLFWVQDGGWKQEQNTPGGPNGKSQPSPTKQRVDNNRRAITEALARRGIGATGGAGDANGGPLPVAGSGAVHRGVPVGFRATGDGVRAAESPAVAGRAENPSGPEVLPPAR